MRVLIALSCLVAVSTAIVCPPNYCDTVKQPLLDCKGGVQTGGGFCGCTDVCAKMEGELCQASVMFGVPSKAACDEGLVCQTSTRAFGLGTCAKQQTKRAEGRKMTKCETMKIQSQISMVVWQGQWFAKCDVQGNFLPMQCDNTRHCFCVNEEGIKQEETYGELGTVQC